MSYYGQFKNSRWNSSPRPAETYRGNRPARATGRGKLKRELLRRERLEAEAKAFVENIQTSFAIAAEIPLRYVGCNSPDEYEAIANSLTNEDIHEYNAEVAHNVKLAQRRERDRAKRAELKKAKA